jgi:hypothetical protein
MAPFWNSLFKKRDDTSVRSLEQSGEIADFLNKMRINEIFSAFFASNPNLNQKQVDMIIKNMLLGIRLSPVDPKVSKWAIPLALCALARGNSYGIGIFNTAKGVQSAKDNLLRINNITKETYNGVEFYNLQINDMQFKFCFIMKADEVFNPKIFDILGNYEFISKVIPIVDKDVFLLIRLRMKDLFIIEVSEKGAQLNYDYRIHDI